MKVIVIIVTYNGMRWIDKCLGSLRQATILPHIFIVDNGSTDGTQDYIKENYRDAIFLQSEINLGFGKANNIGLKYALEHDYDYVYLLNQDAWVEPDTFQKMIEVHKAHNDYGILSPMQMTADYTKVDNNFKFNFERGTPIDNTLTLVKFAMAAHWLLPITTIKTVGLFSPSFPHYGEDVNYVDRLHWFGLKCGVAIKSKAVHDRGERVEPIERLLYKRYMRAIVRVSDPNNKHTLLVMFKEQYKLVKASIRYQCISSLRNVIKLVAAYPTLMCNRIRSKKNGAFKNTITI